MSTLDQAPVPEVEKERLYKEIYDTLYISVQFEVMRKFFSEELEEYDGNLGHLLQNELIMNKWVQGSSSPAAKYGFIFSKIVKDAIEEGEVDKVEDVADDQEEFADMIFDYIKRYDVSAQFEERYSKLKNASAAGAIPPIDFENYRKSDGYGWIYNLIQAEIMWARYKDDGGIDEESNTEDWGNSSSLEYDKAMQIMIFLHGDQLLERFHTNFHKLVEQLEMIMKNISALEDAIEEDLQVPHTEETRKRILTALEEVVVDHAEYILNINVPEIKSKLVNLVEEELKKAA